MAEYVDRFALRDALYDADAITMRGVKIINQFPTAVDAATVRWIPVTERLPESGAHVLISCEMHRYGGAISGKYVCDGYYAEANKIIDGGFPDECSCEYSEEDDEYYLCEGWYEVIKNCDGYDSVPVEDFVTHWMPMPEQPEAEAALEGGDEG